MRLQVALDSLKPDDEASLDELRDAIDAVVDKLPEPWDLAFADLLPGTRTLPEDEVEIERDERARLPRRLQIFGWRLLLASGHAIEAPWPPRLDSRGRVSVRDLSLLWTHFDFAGASYFDLSPVRALVDGSREPLVRALWRAATGAAVDRLDETHRRALARVQRPIDVLRLAVEEARVLEETGQRDDALADLEDLLHDPILRRDHELLACALLGRVRLYRASVASRQGRIVAARRHYLDWKEVQERTEADQVAEIGLVRAELDLAEGHLESGSERVARTLQLLSESAGEKRREVQARVFALSATPSLRLGLYGEAVELVDKARAIHLGAGRPAPQAHVDLVRQLAEARWLFCVHDLCNAGLFDTAESVTRGAIDEIAEEHRPRLRRLREELAEAAPAFLALLSLESQGVYRWSLARGWALEDPYRAIELMVQAIDDQFDVNRGRCRLEAIAIDLVVVLRYLGLSREAVLATESIHFVLEIAPELRGFVEEILDGRRHPLYGLVEAPDGVGSWMQRGRTNGAGSIPVGFVV